eukprot:TRINITY_DN59889_c0_g1_i1.p1 TRINITY_DN59889_c0_g1~~TRINITY_DN59889_c0_g1_i1.p1  ORF type:complete len:412 (+),score=93.88 TRINITY_DN59889_c0_g1_i1:152-1387(+)
MLRSLVGSEMCIRDSCGLQQCKIVVSDPDTDLAIGDWNWSVVLALCATIIMVFMDHIGSELKFLVPMAAASIIGWATKVESDWPSSFVAAPELKNFLDFSLVDAHLAVPAISLYIICLFDIGGLTYAISGLSGLMDDSGTPKGIYWVFVITSVGTFISTALGAVPIIVLGESFAGVLFGGRTGLTAVSTGLAFSVALPFSPILSQVPLYASSPVLLLLGVHLSSHLDTTEWRSPPTMNGTLDLRIAVPAFCTVVLMPFLYSIDKAIMTGLAAHVVLLGLDRCWAWLFPTDAPTTAFDIGDPEDEFKKTPYSQDAKVIAKILRSKIKCKDEAARSFSHHAAGHNVLTKQQFGFMCERLMGEEVPADAVEVIYNILDQDKDGGVSCSEFTDWWHQANSQVNSPAITPAPSGEP